MNSIGIVITNGAPSTAMATRPSSSFPATASGFSLHQIVGKTENGESSMNCST